MEAKPIFITYLPKNILHSEIAEIQYSLEKKLKDYNILCVSYNCSSIKFEVFYEKDYKQADFEELKSIVLNNING